MLRVHYRPAMMTFSCTYYYEKSGIVGFEWHSIGHCAPVLTLRYISTLTSPNKVNERLLLSPSPSSIPFHSHQPHRRSPTDSIYSSIHSSIHSFLSTPLSPLAYQRGLNPPITVLESKKRLHSMISSSSPTSSNAT
jgi:hypothetical protein